MQTTYSSLLQQLLQTWNETEDISFSDFVYQLKLLSSHLKNFIQHGVFLNDMKSSQAADETPPFTDPSSTPSDSPASPAPNINKKHRKYTAQLLHMILSHFGKDTLNRTMANKCFDDVPSDWETINEVICGICKLVKENRPAKSLTLSYKAYPKGSYLFMDFGFIEVESVRGFSAILSVVCASTDYEWAFNTRHKRAPLELITFLLDHFKAIGITVGFVRTDNGGELAKNTEIRRLFLSRGIVIHDNGGYFPASMGKVETRWTPRKNGIKGMLKHAPEEIDKSYWCYASDHYTYITRRLCRKGCTTSPYQQWFDTVPSLADVHPFGCMVYFPLKKHTKLPALHDKYGRGLFLCHGATSHIVNYKVQGIHKVGRCNKPLIDDSSVTDTTISSKPLTLKTIVQTMYLPTSLHDPQFASHFDITSKTIPGDYVEFQATIPLHGPLHITLENDSTFGLPVLKQVSSLSPLYKFIPARLRRNSFIVNINSEEPITVSRVSEYIAFLRQTNNLSFRLGLCKRPTPDRKDFEMLRQFCDQIRPVVAATFIPEVHVNIKVHGQITTPTPATLKDDPYYQFWLMSKFNRFAKNMEIPIWSIPFLLSKLPKNTKIYKPVTIHSVRDTADENIKELYTRICVNGSIQEPYKDYEPQIAPTVGHSSFCFVLAIAAWLDLKEYFGDFSNAYQHTPRPLDGEPVYMSPPPYFMEWFRQEYPQIKLPKKGPFVVEVLTYLNGFRDAGPEFYKLMSKYFKQMNIEPTTVDPSIFFLKREVNGTTQFCLIPTMVDDIGIFVSHSCIFDELQKILTKGLKISFQKGPVYTFGNFRVIFSNDGISVDQTPHILKTLDEFFDNEETIAKVYTPLRTDREFENEMSQALPATKDQLQQLAKKFRGSYLTIFGKLLNIMSGSQPDIANAINRLGVFQSAPTELGFRCLRRILQYLRSLPNIPIMYPRRCSASHSIFHSEVFLANGKEDRLIVPHCLCGHGDISFAPFRYKRHSIEAAIETFSSVIFGWKVGAQVTCATSTTDGELRINFRVQQRVKGCRNLLFQVGLPQNKPTPVFCDNKGVRDFIKGEKMTKNLKHIELPLCVIQENKLRRITECRECTHNTSLADPFTKSCSGNVLRKFRNFYMGIRFYPDASSQHYYLLTHPFHDDPDRKDFLVPLNT